MPSKKKFFLNKLVKPVKIKQPIYFDKRGFFQEIYLKKKFDLNIKFTALAKSKKMLFEDFIFNLRINKLNFFIF